jgi:hypothetical protein
MAKYIVTDKNGLVFEVEADTCYELGGDLTLLAGGGQLAAQWSIGMWVSVVKTAKVKSSDAVIKLSVAEIQSGLTRVRAAENLVPQLPSGHDGRNTWLLNYGIGFQSVALRTSRGVKFDFETLSAETMS